MMKNDRSRFPNSGLVKVLAKPLHRRSSSFFAATARREIHGGRVHCTELPPTLQGFFYSHGDQDVHLLPAKRFGRFASIVERTMAGPAMDTSFEFLSNVVHENEHIFVLDSCNGLILFGVLQDAFYITQEFSYIVCNPATKQWARVPSCNWINNTLNILVISSKEHTSLLFDPTVSSHFQLVLFRDHEVIDELMTRTTTHSYSSKTGVWSHSAANWIEEWQAAGSLERWRFQVTRPNYIISGYPTAFVGGMVYLVLERKLVLKVDPQGNTRCIIPAPPLVHVGVDNNYVTFLGESQGLLHCIVEEGHHIEDEVPACYYHRRWKSCGLSVWTLQDSNTPKWSLKGQMSNLKLFGKKNCEGMAYHVVCMHPDCNVIFFLQYWDMQMMSYDMDRDEARALQSFTNEYGPITLTPYTPYLSDMFAGVTGAHK